MSDLNEELNLEDSLEWFLKSYQKNKTIRSYENLVKALQVDFVYAINKQYLGSVDEVTKKLSEVTEDGEVYFSIEWIKENMLKLKDIKEDE